MEQKNNTSAEPGFVRRLGLFDATMIVMGGIIGSGIFMNPSVVARTVHTPALILGAWIAGGLIALAGAFIYAELASLRPKVGGQYAYLREAYHPIIAFMFAWSLLLVSDTGGMAAVSMTFARYFVELTGVGFSDTLIAVAVLIILTVINCFGVRAGANVQNSLMLIKILAILILIGVGLFFSHAKESTSAVMTNVPFSFDVVTTFGAALVPVMFAYGGWQTSTFITGEIKEPQKNLPRGILIGVMGVIASYTLVNYICLTTLGPDGLAQTKTPASEVMRIALGEYGGTLIAMGIAISTLGFLSQSILVAPRVYYAMAEDGLFFKSVAKLHPTYRVPVLAIILQGIFAIIITLSGQYEEILNYVVLDDFVFFGLTAYCVFIFRKQEKATGQSSESSFRALGHPITTGLFILVCIAIVANTLYTSPLYGTLSVVVILSGIPIYYFWRWLNKRKD